MFRQLLRLSSHSIVYGLGVVVSQAVGFFLIPVYTRYLAPADYGALELLSVTSSVVGIVFAMGLGPALFKSYFSHDDLKSKKMVVSTAFVFVTATSAVFSLLLIGLAGMFASVLFDSGDYTFAFRIVFLTVFCDTSVGVALAVFRAREQPFNYALVSIARVVLSVTLNIAFVVVLHKGVLGIVEAGLVTSASVYAFMLAAVLLKAGVRFSLDELKGMLAFGLPMVPAALGSWILTMSDRYFLRWLSTPTELGLYSLGYKFGLAVSVLLVGPFVTAWMPFMLSIAKDKNAGETYSHVLTYFVLIGMLMVLGLATLSREALIVMATPEFRDAYKVVPLIACSYLLWGCYYVLLVGIYIEAKTKYLVPIEVGAAILNMGLNYLLIPHYGMMGAAGATLICYMALPIVVFYVSRRYYAIRYEWVRIGKIVLAAGIVYVCTLLIDSAYGAVHSHIVVGVLKLVVLAAFPIVLCLLRFYQQDEIAKGRQVIKGLPGYVRARIDR